MQTGRDLPSRRELLSRLTRGIADASVETFHARAVRILRAALTDGRESIRENLANAPLGSLSGDTCIRDTVYLADQIIKALADYTTQEVYPTSAPTKGERLCIAGHGGYGRGELAPYSDIDLLFILPYKRTPRVEQMAEFMLYVLWDLGWAVGHAVRSVDECIRQSREDITIRTSLLEARYLWGETPLFAELKRRFQREIVTSSGQQFVEAKLSERDHRHQRMGDSRYFLEPNIKDGKGGLRDLQTLFWIAKYLYRVDDITELVSRGVLSRQEAQLFDKARTFLWTVRCHLHYLAGRSEERLTFDVQAEIGRRLGYTDHAGTLGVERFMKHYFLVAKDVGDLTRIFCAALEAEAERAPRFSLRRLGFRVRHLEGFVLDGDRLNIETPRHFKDQPLDMIRLFHVAHNRDADIHPNALRALTRALRGVGPKLRTNPDANALFLDILTSRKDPEGTLRRMNEAGLLGRFLPDFGRVVAQMQYDMYHVFTVDEHSLLAIGLLHRLETGALDDGPPLVTQLFRKIASRRALYVATLLHDIAKGRGGDHSELGARVAEKLCPRLGLSDEETETISWLIRHHLAMSDAAFKRDLEDDQTIRAFIELVQSPERLRLLMILTTADIMAVGPGRWNNWKATLLTELYHRAEDMMSEGFSSEPRTKRVEAAQAALSAELHDWTPEAFQAHIARGYPGYWLSFDAETHAHHARLIADAEAKGQALTVATRVDPDSASTEVTIYTADHPGLSARLAGALAMAGANIVDAKLFTMTNGMALDVFHVQDMSNGPLESSDRLDRLRRTIDQTLRGEIQPRHELLHREHDALPKRSRVFPVPPRVLIDNEASLTHTVIEVNGRDRPGLLATLTYALTSLNLQVSSAKISTYGQKAIDVFYVKDVFGLKVSHRQKLKEIRTRLIEALGGSEADVESDSGSYTPDERRRTRRTRYRRLRPAATSDST